MASSSQRGSPLLEIFNIRYLGDDEVTANKQIGSIIVKDGRFSHCLYNVSEEDENLPPIRHMSSLVLNVHERSISLQRTSSTDIVFELFSQMFVSSIPVKWSGDSNVNFYEERILSKDGTGEIAVQLGLFSNAKEAHIEIDLSSEEAVDIYGIVAASTDAVEVSTFTSMIFLVKEPERRLKVNPGKIPLCRSVVAAPLDSVFFLDIGLNIDGALVKMTLQFDTSSSRISKVVPCSTNRSIKVTVDFKTKMRLRGN